MANTLLLLGEIICRVCL